MKHSVRLLVPTLAPVRTEVTYDAYVPAVAELAQVLRTLAWSDPYAVVRIAGVEEVTGPTVLRRARQLLGEAPTSLLKIKHLVRGRRMQGLELEAEVELKSDTMLAELRAQPEVTDEDILSITEHFASDYLVEAACGAILAAAIARTGAIQTCEGVSLSGNAGRMEPRTRTWHISSPIERAATIGWPPLADVSIADSLRWLQRLPGHEQSVGTCRFGRAVACLSYILSPEHDVESGALWPLIALEALYCSGKEGLQAQILDKSEAFLGRRSTHHKTFKAMYNARSKFVHGQAPLPMAFTVFDATPVAEQLRDEMGDSKELATAVLVATLRKAIATNRTSLEFVHSLVADAG